MEISFSILIILGILFYIRSCKNKIINNLDNLEVQITSLQEKIDKLNLKTVIQPEEESTAKVISPEEKPVEPVIEKAPEPVIYSPAPAWKKEEIIVESIVKDAIYKPNDSIKVVEDQTTATEQQEPIIEEVFVEPFSSINTSKETDSDKEMRDLEKFFGENLLSKIGITTLVLGIGYFVKYAIDQNWINEIGRVAIGILLGGAVIGVAHKLKNNYRTFSSILVGGGISILYITVMIAFRDYQIFSQTVAFILLILITIFSVFLSMLYDRKELAIFSLLGGFASPFMVSTGSGNYIVLFSYILILNTGMLILAFKKHWKVVSIIAYVLTQLLFWSWLTVSFKDEYFGAGCFILLFFIQFYALALIDHYKESRQITAFQSFIILSNNLSLFAAWIYIFEGYHINVKGIITMIIAVLNAIPMVLLFKDRTVDKRLIYLLIALVLTFVSLAIPIQLNGIAITMFWAVEAIILLWLWQKSGIKIFQYGFILIELLVMGSLLMDWWNFYFDSLQIFPIILNKPFITGAIITITVWVNAWLLRKESDDEFLGFPLQKLINIFCFAGVILIFTTLFLELQYQMDRFYDPAEFRNLIYGLYLYVFIAVLTLIRWNKEKWSHALYIGLIITILTYVSAYSLVVFQTRGYVLNGFLSSWGYFAMHYPAVLCLILFFIFLIRKKQIISESGIHGLIDWLVASVSVVILSLEADNVMLMLFYKEPNQDALLKTSHNIIYPILWGISSFILMIIGMKKKNRNLRIISLTLLGLIIAKLYLYDIWKMEQAGRIIAFIFLGVLFLLVSFLYQKLKVLLLKKEKEKEEIENNQEKQDE